MGTYVEMYSLLRVTGTQRKLIWNPPLAGGRLWTVLSVTSVRPLCVSVRTQTNIVYWDGVCTKKNQWATAQQTKTDS